MLSLSLLFLSFGCVAADRNYLWVVDAGSSGTKFFLYSDNIDSCPEKGGNGYGLKDGTDEINKLDYDFKNAHTKAHWIQWCGKFSIKPKLATLVTRGTENLKAVRAFLGHVMAQVDYLKKADDPKANWNGAGYATAGNRIINSGVDSFVFRHANIEWGEVVEAQGMDQRRVGPVINFDDRMKTIAGTNEAYYEWVAVNFDSAIDSSIHYHGAAWSQLSEYAATKTITPLNFISTGGASAQLGIHIPNAITAKVWLDRQNQFKGYWDANCPHTQYHFNCNNQDDFQDFLTAIVFKPESNIPLLLETASDCDKYHCIGLISFLAGESIDTGGDSFKCILGTEQGGVNDVKHNYVGGLKETFWTFTKFYPKYRQGVPHHEAPLNEVWCEDPQDTLNVLIEFMKKDLFFSEAHIFLRGLFALMDDHADRVVRKIFYTAGNFGLIDFDLDENFGTWADCSHGDGFKWTQFFLHAFVQVMFQHIEGWQIKKSQGNKGAWTFGLATTAGKNVPCDIPISHYELKIGINDGPLQVMALPKFQTKIASNEGKDECKIDLTDNINYLTVLEQTIEEFL